jgi:hypothetical protein
MIIRGAAIHCDGHGKFGLLVATRLSSFYRHRVSTNLTGISLINSQRTPCCVLRCFLPRGK